MPRDTADETATSVGGRLGFPMGEMHDMELVGHPVEKNVVYGGNDAHPGAKKTFEVSQLLVDNKGRHYHS